MSRPWRIEYEGALYHVLSRGNDQRDIFNDDRDRFSFIKTVGEMSERFVVDVFAYVMMGNHYHLLIRTNRANLSRCMQWLGATYTKRFNTKHGRIGHLFQSRFKSIIVENDAYLLRLSCYIHRNPLRAGMVERLADYPWSTYLVYAYGQSHPNWLNTGLILSQLSGTDTHKTYREKVQTYAKEEPRVWEDFWHGMYLGSEKFADRIRNIYLPEQPEPEMPQQKEVFKDIDIERVLNQGAAILDSDFSRLRDSLRISVSDRDNRDLLIYLIWQSGVCTNLELGSYFGLTYSAVSRRASVVRMKMQDDEPFQEKYQKLKSLIKT